MVNATVIQFRQGRSTQKPRHFLLEMENVDSREKAQKFVGNLVEWVSPGQKKKIIKGEIKSAHGNKGILRAVFEKGLPGQAIGTDVEIKETKSSKIKK